MGQVDCPVTNMTEVLTVHMQRFQKRIEPAEFYRKAKADGSVPGLGWEHLEEGKGRPAPSQGWAGSI